MSVTLLEKGSDSEPYMYAHDEVDMCRQRASATLEVASSDKTMHGTAYRATKSRERRRLLLSADINMNACALQKTAMDVKKVTFRGEPGNCRSQKCQNDHTGGI